MNHHPAEAALRANRGLVWSVVRRRTPPPGLDTDDLFSAGLLGLLNAWNDYRPEVGEFSTYAVWRIRGAISDLTEKAQRRCHRLTLYEDMASYVARDGRKGGVALLEELGLLPGGGAPDVDRLAVRVMLGQLRPDHRETLTWHYLEGLTFEEMGQRWGVTKQTAKHRERVALVAARQLWAE